jgi:hypothetical protein
MPIGEAFCPGNAEAARGERVEVLARTVEQQSIREPELRFKSTASALARGDPANGAPWARSWSVLTAEATAGLAWRSRGLPTRMFGVPAVVSETAAEAMRRVAIPSLNEFMASFR